FHGSKGLQFPICIIAGVGNNFNKTDLNDRIILSNDYGLGLNIVSNGLKINTISRKALRIVQNEKLIAEELRLRYVAMTRAEERLMISVTSSKCVADIVSAATDLGLSSINTGLVPADAVISASGFKTMLLSALLLQKSGEKLGEIADINPIGHNGDAEFNIVYTENTSFDDVPIEVSTEIQQNYSCDIKTKKMLDERFNFDYPYSADIKIPSKMAVTSIVHGDKTSFAFKSRPRFMSKAGLTPAERGTAMHKVMQFIDFKAADIDLSSELERLYEHEFFSFEECESLDREALKNFFKSGLFNRLKSAQKVLREYKFMVNYPYENSETIIQGIADCIFFENGKAIIVDFKTDNVSSLSELKERYTKQLEIYKLAISEIFSVTVSECIIYSTHLSSEISI
ncbi:MAG: PD-(D/E)XK nuclease family protein, partial [Clostridia bacterium]|nr:PD-(D/E)XK nuclease family protein [Clostridia bacterium]